MAGNPFNLEDREGGGPARPHAARVWTAEEQADKLAGYLEVSPEHWEHLRYGTHVRYITKDGQFRSGGFVLRNPVDMRPKGATADKRYVKLQNGFNHKIKGYVAWAVAYDDTDKIYMKPDAGIMTMLTSLETAVEGLNGNIRKLAAYTRELEKRITALEGGKK
jgi:hypothetical protein